MSAASAPRLVFEKAPPSRPMAMAEAGQSPYRRPAVVPRHRRKRRLLGALKLFLASLFIVGLPVALTWWSLTTPQLALESLAVGATERVPVVWVEEALEPFLGQNLLRLSLSATRLQLGHHPWVEAASIRKLLPHGLKVDIVQRQPMAVLVGETGRFYVDRRGEVIAQLGATESVEALPLLRGIRVVPDDVRRALVIAAEPGRADLPWKGPLLEIEILGSEDFRLSFEDVPFPLLVRHGSLEEKQKHLYRVLPEIAARYRRVKALDLRFARRIVLQPEVDGSHGAPGVFMSRG